MCFFVMKPATPRRITIVDGMILVEDSPASPGFPTIDSMLWVHCLCHATAAICIGGGLNYATTTATFVPGFEAQGYIQISLLPSGSEPGIAIAACWVLLFPGGRWRTERSWIDLLGRILGVYWLAMIVIARFAPFDLQNTTLRAPLPDERLPSRKTPTRSPQGPGDLQ